LKSLVAEPSFWDLFPHARLGVLVITDVDNSEAGNGARRPGQVAALEAASEAAQRHLEAEVFSQNPVVAAWRDAFAKFRTKKGARSSIEALLKRIDSGRGVGPINPLVDVYNAVSLEYALPCGIEDLDAIAGDLRLVVTTGGDPFQALGDEAPSETLPGEVCYLDDKGAVCRCWNWREGERTMLTEGTSRAVAVLESVDPARHADLDAALAALAARVEDLMGARVVRHAVLSAGSPAVSLETAT